MLNVYSWDFENLAENSMRKTSRYIDTDVRGNKPIRSYEPFDTSGSSEATHRFSPIYQHSPGDWVMIELIVEWLRDWTNLADQRSLERIPKDELSTWHETQGMSNHKSWDKEFSITVINLAAVQPFSFVGSCSTEAYNCSSTYPWIYTSKRTRRLDWLSGSVQSQAQRTRLSQVISRHRNTTILPLMDEI